MARAWGITPRQAEREIYDDPERLALVLLPLLRYADAHRVYRSADKKRMKGFEDKEMLQRVTEIDAEFVAAELEKETGE